MHPAATPSPSFVHAASQDPDADAAVAEIAARLGDRTPHTLLFFCSPAYDLDRLALALRGRFAGTLVGCTSAGQIGPEGFQLGGITAIAICDVRVAVRVYGLRSLVECHGPVAAIGMRVRADLVGGDAKAFGLLLVDGLSLAEERLAAALHEVLGPIPMVGGSAGDDLRFEQTQVYVDGGFCSDSAALVVFETSLPFSTFKLQHFVPTRRRLVITDADPDRRIVRTIDGYPAAAAYAELVGVPVEALAADVFSTHPVMVRLGDEYYVRSIQKVNADGSLTFYCAIEEGLVLTIGEGVDALRTLTDAFATIEDAVKRPQLVIACDCILRRLELEHDGLADEVGRFLARHRVVGFCTYGEQYNAMHVNQTLVGVAIGE